MSPLPKDYCEWVWEKTPPELLEELETIRTTPDETAVERLATILIRVVYDLSQTPRLSMEQMARMTAAECRAKLGWPATPAATEESGASGGAG